MYIPVVAAPITDLLMAPCPFLMGILADVLNYVDISSEAVIVNLMNNTVKHNIEIPDLPAHQYDKLLKRLHEYVPCIAVHCTHHQSCRC